MEELPQTSRTVPGSAPTLRRGFWLRIFLTTQVFEIILARMKPVRPFLLLVALASWASVISTQAASGTWTNRNGGSWTNTANWNAAIIADGSGNTANFSTLNLSSDVTVTLDGPRTVGNLNFDDQNSTKHNWLLNAGSGGPLTLAGATPTFTVLSATTSVS